MARVVFYEKPGCIANRRQKALLRRSGHALELRNLLEEDWTEERLRPFFGALPVGAWFNPSAPAVKTGRVVPRDMGEAGALAAMCADPLLIRRPLMQVGTERRAGFVTEAVAAWIGLVAVDGPVGDSCPLTGP